MRPMPETVANADYSSMKFPTFLDEAGVHSPPSGRNLRGFGWNGRSDPIRQSTAPKLGHFLPPDAPNRAALHPDSVTFRQK